MADDPNSLLLNADELLAGPIGEEDLGAMVNSDVAASLLDEDAIFSAVDELLFTPLYTPPTSTTSSAQKDRIAKAVASSTKADHSTATPVMANQEMSDDVEELDYEEELEQGVMADTAATESVGDLMQGESMGLEKGSTTATAIPGRGENALPKGKGMEKDGATAESAEVAPVEENEERPTRESKFISERAPLAASEQPPPGLKLGCGATNRGGRTRGPSRGHNGGYAKTYNHHQNQHQHHGNSNRAQWGGEDGSGAVKCYINPNFKGPIPAHILASLQRGTYVSPHAMANQQATGFYSTNLTVPPPPFGGVSTSLSLGQAFPVQNAPGALAPPIPLGMAAPSHPLPPPQHQHQTQQLQTAAHQQPGQIAEWSTMVDAFVKRMNRDFAAGPQRSPLSSASSSSSRSSSRSRTPSSRSNSPTPASSKNPARAIKSTSPRGGQRRRHMSISPIRERKAVSPRIDRSPLRVPTGRRVVSPLRTRDGREKEKSEVARGEGKPAKKRPASAGEGTAKAERSAGGGRTKEGEKAKQQQSQQQQAQHMADCAKTLGLDLVDYTKLMEEQKRQREEVARRKREKWEQQQSQQPQEQPEELNQNRQLPSATMGTQPPPPKVARRNAPHPPILAATTKQAPRAQIIAAQSQNPPAARSRMAIKPPGNQTKPSAATISLQSTRAPAARGNTQSSRVLPPTASSTNPHPVTIRQQPAKGSKVTSANNRLKPYLAVVVKNVGGCAADAGADVCAFVEMMASAMGSVKKIWQNPPIDMASPVRVIFEHHEHAKEFMSRYNSKTLKGHKLDIALEKVFLSLPSTS